MVITISCPSCAAAFPVDPNKIPAGGVRARCSTCGHVFRVEKPASGPAAPAQPAVEVLPPPPPAVAASVPRPRPHVIEEPAQPPPRVVEAPVAPPRPRPEAAPTPRAVQGFTFGRRDPTDKAKRLARVLVSDMIMYNAERHQTALATGTLEQDFEEEIEKSWKEYVEQVGRDLADGPGREFWREALNDILAKGRQIF